jgi:hypothetical protein
MSRLSSPLRRLPRDRTRRQADRRIVRLQDQIRAIDYLCSGTLIRRMKQCGKPTCRCARDPGSRHGPYYEWGVMRNGRLVHRMVSIEQARFLRRAIASYRRVLRVLRQWEAQSMKTAELTFRRKR